VSQEGNVWVVKVGNQVVCRAMSVRQNEHSAEAYVETLPAYQRRGYGRQATAAWADDILKSGRVPFYSYHLANSASAALARSLSIEWYADVVGYERL
jgi:predicted GNAT family acetyltransferase